MNDVTHGSEMGLKHRDKKESQNGSPRTQLSMELHFGANLYSRAVSERQKSLIWLSIV